MALEKKKKKITTTGSLWSSTWTVCRCHHSALNTNKGQVFSRETELNLDPISSKENIQNNTAQPLTETNTQEKDKRLLWAALFRSS